MSDDDRLPSGAGAERQAFDGSQRPGTPGVPEEVLARRPERRVGFEVDDDGRITVLEPKFTGPFLGRLLQPRLAKPHIRTRLDEVGSLVWQACDGQTDVRTMAIRIADRFGPDFDPDGQRLATFLQTMARRGLIRYRTVLPLGVAGSGPGGADVVRASGRKRGT